MGASRARRDGVRVEWKASARASKYEVWRSGTQSGRGLRVGTTTRTTFLDKRGARGVAYYYGARRPALTVPWRKRDERVRYRAEAIRPRLIETHA